MSSPSEEEEKEQVMEARMLGTVVKRSGARVFILEDHQQPDATEKDLWFISARRFRDANDGWKVKPGDRVSFSASNMARRPNPVANDAYIVSSAPDTGIGAGNVSHNPQDYRSDEDDVPPPSQKQEGWTSVGAGSSGGNNNNISSVSANQASVASGNHRSGAGEGGDEDDEAITSFWRRCPICPGVVASSLEEWEAHLAGEEHGAALRARAKAAPAAGGGPVLMGVESNSQQLTQSRFPFAQLSSDHEPGAPVGNAGGAAPWPVPQHIKDAADEAPKPAANVSGAPAPAPAPSAPAAAPGVGQASISVPRHSPDEPARVTVTYKNNFIMEYEWPDVTIPVAVLRRAPAAEVIRRQWLVQRLELVMGEMDEQLPRTAFQNSANDWRDSFLARLEMHTGERWTWKKIDGELCLGEGKSSATFWRALRVGIQSAAHAAHANVLVVKPANSTQKMLFGKCLPSELPRSWEIPTHGKFIRLSFVRPELVYAHHQRLNGSTVVDEQGREVTITTEVDVPSLMPVWRLDWRALMAMPEPIFPGSIHVVGTPTEAPRAIEKLVASVAPDGLIGLWGEWSGDTKGHEYNRLQVIQLATEKCSIVFKVGTWKQLPQAALDVFTHPRLRTVALGGQEITKKLRKDFRVDVTGGIDVLDLPAAQRCQPRSLKGLVGVFLQWNVGMDQSGSQWDAPRLTPAQLTHAATRPWLVLVLYRKILTINYNSVTGVVEGTLIPKPGLM